MISFKKFLIEGFLLENRAWHGFIRQYGPEILKKAELHDEYLKTANHQNHGSPEHLTNFLSDNLGMTDLTPEEGRWVFKNFHRGGIRRAEDIQATVIPALMDLRKAKAEGRSKVDLPSITSSGALNNHLNKVYPERALKEYDISPQEYTVHGSNDHWTLIQPHSKNSACALGRGSSWCTASRGSGNRFEHYNESDKGVFILIPKEPRYENEKYQFSGHPDEGLSQFMNKNDNPVETSDEHWPDFKTRPLPEIDPKNTHLSSLLKSIDLIARINPKNFSADDITELLNGGRYEQVRSLVDSSGTGRGNTAWRRVHTQQVLNHIDDKLSKALTDINKLPGTEPIPRHHSDLDTGFRDIMHILNKSKEAHFGHLDLEPIASKLHELQKHGQYYSLTKSIAGHQAFDPFYNAPRDDKKYNSLHFFLKANRITDEDLNDKLESHIKYQPDDIEEHHISAILDHIQQKVNRSNSDDYEGNKNLGLMEALMKHPKFNLSHAISFFNHKGTSLGNSGRYFRSNIQNWFQTKFKSADLERVMERAKDPSNGNHVITAQLGLLKASSNNLDPNIIEKGLQHPNQEIRNASLNRLVGGTILQSPKDQPTPVWGFTAEKSAELMKKAIDTGGLDAHFIFATGMNIGHHFGPEQNQWNEKEEFGHIRKPLIDHFITTVKGSTYPEEHKKMVFSHLLKNHKDALSPTFSGILTQEQQQDVESYLNVP